MNRRVLVPALPFFLLVAGAAILPGCLGPVFGEPVVYSPTVSPTPVAEVTEAPRTPASMALVPEDLPGRYSILDRSVIAYEETGQISRELGWIQGYRVILTRTGTAGSSITGIRQVIGVYSPDTIANVFTIERENLLEPANGTRRYEIAFPRIGDKSVAVRITGPDAPGETAVYSVLFIKRNICEQITMGGTATDYEVLKTAALKAAAKIP